MKKGFIYILSNNSLKDNLFKIGKTGKETSNRTKQLSSSTSIPENFEIEGEFDFSDINWAEKKVHSALSKYRPNKRKEFFNCSFDIAKQVIIELQIIDKEKQINNLKKEVNGIGKILKSSEFIKHKWLLFFQKMNWEFLEFNNKEGKLNPDFVLKTKEWNDENTNEETKDREIEILERPTYLYIIPNLPKKSAKINDLEILEQIIPASNKKHKLILLSEKPIENFSSIIFGWRYNFIHGHWNEVQFIKKGNKYGLLDEERTWFCMVNGEFLERENLYPNEEKIIEIWNQ